MVGTRHSVLATRGPGGTCSQMASRATCSMGRSRQNTALSSRKIGCRATGHGGASERVVLGESDLSVSRCCLGTMTWGQQNTEAEAHEQLDYAFENGINFLDTAEIYPVPPVKETQGLTDRYIGSWFASRQNRDKVVLATKVSGYGRQSYLRKDGSTPRVNEKNIVESVDASLERLGVDHVDLLQVHWPDRYVPLFGAASYDASLERPDDVPFEEQLRGLEKVIQAGKVRYIGVSNETSYGVMKFSQLAESAGLPKIQTIQNSYSLIARSLFETDLAEVCAPRQCNVSLLAYSPLAGGALTGKYITDDESKIAKSRFTLFEGYMKRYQQSIGREAVAEYCNVAKLHGLTPTELALAWCNSRWFVSSTIIGATTMDQLKENIASFDVQLSEECAYDVGNVYKRYRDPSFN